MATKTETNDSETDIWTIKKDSETGIRALVLGFEGNRSSKEPKEEEIYWMSFTDCKEPRNRSGSCNIELCDID